MFNWQCDEQAKQESPDVRPHRDSSVRGRTQRSNPAEKLQHKPQTQHQDRRHSNHENKYQSQDAVARLQNNVTTQNARNSSACSKRRKVQEKIESDVRDARSY